MWLQRFSRHLLSHPVQAIIFTFVISFVPLIGIIGIIIAAFVTLTKSIFEGAILTFVAMLAYIISTYWSSVGDPSVPSIVWYLFGGIVVMSNLVTWVFSIMLSRHSSWTVILELATLFGVLVVSVVHLVHPNIAEWWEMALRPYFTYVQTLAGVKDLSSEVMLPAHKAIFFGSMTGLLTALVIANGVIQLIVARWWQAAVFKPRMLKAELQNIRLSQLAGVLFVISIVLAYLGNRVVLDIMPILYVLFGAAGLSVIHFVAGKSKSTTIWFWLAILYVTIIFSLPISNLLIMLIATLALADIWLDLRKRLKKNFN